MTPTPHDITDPGVRRSGMAQISFCVVLCSVTVAIGASPAQQGRNPAGTWTPPRTPDGHPDLQGVWNYAAGTPLERPAAYGEREFLTDDELIRTERSLRERATADRRDGADSDADLGREAKEELNRRIVPLDGRRHLFSTVAPWLGDSRGRWEGNTLVIETTNFREQRPYAGVSTTARLRLIERLTRVSADTVDYRFTVEDPTTWTRPWTAVVVIEKSDANLYEFACHEGNYSLPHILSGARAQEKFAGRP